MMAAENGALPGGRAGGLGDVIRDLPRALAGRRHRVDVVTPGYGRLSRLPNTERQGHCDVTFAGRRERLHWFRARAPIPSLGVHHWLVENERFSATGSDGIYFHDPPERPFATDAGKFALFCLGVAENLAHGALPRPDVIHLHDWHASLMALLCRHHPHFAALGEIPIVYSIHSLALQGIRPLHGDPSSLAAWFPDAEFPVLDIVDPRYPDCMNPTRAALRLCDRIHAVSPGYASEILESSDPARGFPGGEGLEQDLRAAQATGRLLGILNGVTYPEAEQPRLLPEVLLARCEPVVNAWLSEAENERHRLAARRLAAWRESPISCNTLVTSVGSVTSQKLGLLLQPMADARPVLDHLLDALGRRGRLVMLGTGDATLERAFSEFGARRDNFLFLCGRADGLSQLLYSSGDLLLMPSTFEPCGTSPLLALHYGQPCLVHGVGGLRDSVDHGKTGFVFSGQNPLKQAANLLACFAEALSLKRDQPERWEAICQAAARRHFTWEDTAREMEAKLYRFGGTLT